MREQLIQLGNLEKRTTLYSILSIRLPVDLRNYVINNPQEKEELFNLIAKDPNIFQGLTTCTADAILIADLFEDKKEIILKWLLNNNKFAKYLLQSDSRRIEALLSCFQSYEEKIVDYIFLNEERINLIIHDLDYFWIFVSSLCKYQDHVFSIIMNSNDLFKSCVQLKKIDLEWFIEKIKKYFEFDGQKMIDGIFLHPERFAHLSRQPSFLWMILESLTPEYQQKAKELILYSDEIFQKCINSFKVLDRFIAIFPDAESKARCIFLKPKIDNLVKEVLRYHPNLKETVSSILQFMESTEPLPFKKANRSVIAYEMLSCVIRPYMVNQKSTNLCGPAAFLMLLLSHRPELCIQQFLELISHGKTSWPLNLKSSEESKSIDSEFSLIFLSAIKNTSNKFIGYSFHRLEQFRGITQPDIICKWLRSCGFTEIKEAMIINATNGKELPWYHRLIIGGVYDTHHQLFDTLQASFNQAIREAESGKGVMFMLSSQFKFGQGCVDQSEYNPCESDTMLGIRMSHYVLVQDLHYDEKNEKVDMIAWSGGARYIMEVDLDKFLAHYQGFISAMPMKQLVYNKSNTLQQGCDAENKLFSCN